MDQGSRDAKLFEAVLDRDVEQVRNLLEEGASPKVEVDGKPVIHQACDTGHFGIMRALVEAGSPFPEDRIEQVVRRAESSASSAVVDPFDYDLDRQYFKERLGIE